MAVLPESMGPVRRRALPLDLDFLRVKSIKAGPWMSKYYQALAVHSPSTTIKASRPLAMSRDCEVNPAETGRTSGMTGGTLSRVTSGRGASGGGDCGPPAIVVDVKMGEPQRHQCQALVSACHVWLRCEMAPPFFR